MATVAKSCNDRQAPDHDARAHTLPTHGSIRDRESPGPNPQPPIPNPFSSLDQLDAEQLNRQAMLLGQSGKLDEAVALLERAVELDPTVGATHNNLGIALARLRRFELAADRFQRAIALWPTGAQPHNNLASCLAEQGRYAEAVVCFERALRLDPAFPDARFNLALALRAAGRLDEAADEFRRVLRAAPHLAKAHLQLGATLAAQRKLDEAIDAFRRALELTPYDAEAHLQLGAALKDALRYAEAVQCCQDALRLQPRHFMALSNLGTALTLDGRPERALDYFRRADELAPGSAALLSNWGIALAAAGRFDEALEKYGRALAIKPDFAEAHNNRASALVSRARYAEAAADYDRALDLKPDFPEVRRNRSLWFLLHGDFQRGWPEYECRWQCRDFERHEFARQTAAAPPAWNGGPLDGKTILLHAEQGMGDTIQFIRYAPLVKARGATVVVRVPRQLAALLKDVAGVDRLLTGDGTGGGSPMPQRPAGCLAADAPVPSVCDDFDVQLPLMSLPRIFGTTLETIPNTVPYLSVEERLVEAWRAELDKIRGSRIRENSGAIRENSGAPDANRLTPDDFLVGIAWQGNPRYPADRQRSLPLAHFAALAGLPRVRLINLQKGHGAEQLLHVADAFDVSEPVGEVDRRHGRFVDTAAIMKNLDLVVTSDSAVAHLAGALGVPVWMAVPFSPDWRWLLGRDDSPWYPTMRLFRQTAPGDWPGVFRRIRKELAELARRRKGTRQRAQGRGEIANCELQIANLQMEAGRVGQDCGAIAGPPTNDADHGGPALASSLVPPYNPKSKIENPKFLNDRGVQLAESGRRREALLHFRRALWLAPRSAEAHYNLGATLAGFGRLDQAAACFRRCLRLSPRNAEARVSLGAALAGLGQPQQAEQELRRALRQLPGAAGPHYSLGNVLAAQGKWCQALDRFQQALKRDARYAQAHFGMANVFRQQAQFPKALAAYGRALELQPDFHEARRQRAMTHLSLGDFEQGWGDYSSAVSGPLSVVSGDGPRTTDHGQLHGKRLLLTAGDDLGETLLLLRFAAVANARGTTVWVRCPAGHETIVGGCRGVDRVFAGRCQPPEADLSLPLGDLPLLLGSPGPEQAAGLPFLRLAPELVEEWRRKLAPLSGFKIGVDWRCDARDGAAPKEWIESLAEVLGVRVIDLSERSHHAPGDASRASVMTAPALAALIANLDLVIATDGVCARLAGALGVPLFAALPVVPEWCWLLDRGDSPWFPTARLFRQSRRGEWTDVCERITGQIRDILSDERRPTGPHCAEADGLCARGAASIEQGDAEGALALFERALATAPDDPAVYNNLGSALMRLGRGRDAAAEFRQALKRRPRYPEALLNLGSALAGLGEHAEAIAYFRKALRQRPHWARAHFYLGNCLLAEGNGQRTTDHWQAALASYREAARLDPDDGDIQVNLAVALRETGRLDESAATLQGLLRRDARRSDASNNLAVTYCRQQRYWQAIECLQDALRRRPKFAAAHNNLGITWAHLQRYGDAVAAYRRALAIEPDYVEAHNNLGISLTMEGRYEEALATFERALELRPDYPEALNNQGIALRELGRPAEAIAAYERAIAVKPDYADAHLNRGFACLLQGDLLPGWQEYEWRFQTRPAAEKRFAQPRWDHAQLSTDNPKSVGDLAGRTLFVHCEQGLGDTIQFIRYAALLKQRGARVVVRCQSRMTRLLNRVAGIDQVVTESGPLPEFDYHMPLLSLPRMFGTTLETIPNQVPYLSADPELIESWRERLLVGWDQRACERRPTESGVADGWPALASSLVPPCNPTPNPQLPTPPFLIGVNWQGNAHYQGDRQRSFPVACLTPLADLPGVRLIGLQKGVRHEQLVRMHGGRHAGEDQAEQAALRAANPKSKIENPKLPIADLGPDVDEAQGAFMDTAAVMMNLDLVITSDTAVAHLAGALGRPVWVALPYSADWRWLLARDDSPWYPTMRLYRQTARGDWTSVFERIKNDLARLVEEAR